ncbi:hypothetical protein F2Q69_00042954 [Brassica cretica]|uniref:Uncharacterized protein n=1 Tax=Brassica cretica TaxID=69181 RepID=A0A8S9NJT3_BRACR|nr:hypothetical protein F2Q69_00042954 [Brassica cretica]
MPVLLKSGQSASQEEAVEEMKDCRSTKHPCHRSTVMPEYGLSIFYVRLKPRSHTKLSKYPWMNRNPIYVIYKPLLTATLSKLSILLFLLDPPVRFRVQIGYEGLAPNIELLATCPAVPEATRKINCYSNQILQVWNVQSAKEYAPHRSTTTLVRRSILVNHRRPRHSFVDRYLSPDVDRYFSPNIDRY